MIKSKYLVFLGDYGMMVPSIPDQNQQRARLATNRLTVYEPQT